VVIFIRGKKSSHLPISSTGPRYTKGFSNLLERSDDPLIRNSLIITATEARVAPLHTAMADTNSEKNRYLLKLPREIRDNIYDHVFRGTFYYPVAERERLELSEISRMVNIIQSQELRESHAEPNQGSVPALSPLLGIDFEAAILTGPGILGACKQLRKEALPFFLRLTPLVYDDLRHKGDLNETSRKCYRKFETLVVSDAKFHGIKRRLHPQLKKVHIVFRSPISPKIIDFERFEEATVPDDCTEEQALLIYNNFINESDNKARLAKAFLRDVLAHIPTFRWLLRRREEQPSVVVPIEVIFHVELAVKIGNRRRDEVSSLSLLQRVPNR
jgi:hypothetical protein